MTASSRDKQLAAKELAVIVRNFQIAQTACNGLVPRGDGKTPTEEARCNLTALKDWRERLLSFDVSVLLE